jgi:hypothetical protein
MARTSGGFGSWSPSTDREWINITLEPGGFIGRLDGVGSDASYGIANVPANLVGSAFQIHRERGPWWRLWLNVLGGGIRPGDRIRVEWVLDGSSSTSEVFDFERLNGKGRRV